MNISSIKNLNLNNPYINNNLRFKDALGETEAGLVEDIDAADLNQSN